MINEEEKVIPNEEVEEVVDNVEEQNEENNSISESEGKEDGKVYDENGYLFEDDNVEFIPPNNISDFAGLMNNFSENDVVESEEDKEDLLSIDLDSIVPLGVSKRILSIEGNKVNVANLAFMCRSTDKKVFTIGKNYVIDTKEKNDMIENLPFYNDNKFENYKSSVNMIANSVDSYISTLDASTSKDFYRESDPIFEVECRNIVTKSKAIINMNANQYDCVKFIDNYIYEGINNAHDLALASTLAINNTPEDIFLVDKIESIVDMAPAVISKRIKKEIKSIGVVLKLSKFISSEEKEIAYCLIPFDSETRFNIKKFKGANIEDITNKYYGDSDQYISRLMTNTRLYGVDKEYMIIKAVSKDDKYRMFLFDNATKEELIKMIEEY